MVAWRRKIWNDCRILMALRAVVISSEVERSSLQTDERRELENRKTQHEGVFRAGAGGILIAVQQRSLGCARDDRGDWCLLVSSLQSLGTPNPWPCIPAFKLQGSGFRVQGCSGGFAANMMGLRSKRIVISSEVERSPLQTDERRELENRKTQHEGAFLCKGRSVSLIAMQQGSLGCVMLLS